ncbi:hypothetical protein TRIUR3_22614 [Triticum urartu]|uniref:Uncharacterized protein n=1 Tax=Triticum urartu TaxID=4572 RepID=M7ZR86_TRIUA|nr:hypothetical protein TRIUR3_22614 [Triticum urartu]
MELGSGEPKEIMDLVSGKPMETIALGSGKLHDYPSVRRLRNRRLLLYLRHQGFDTAYDSVVRESGVQMSKLHLRQLLIWGRWSEALNYIRRFLPPASKDRGREVRSLIFFLHMLRALDNVAACSKSGLVSDSAHGDLRFLTMQSQRQALLHPPIHAPTAAVQMYHVLQGASGLDAEIENKDMSNLIIPSMISFNLPVPIVKAPPEGTIPAAKTRCYCQVLSQQEKEGCLKAGKIPELHQEQPLQSNANEGATGSPLLQTMFGTVTNPSKNTRISSVTNAAETSNLSTTSCTKSRIVA